MKKLLIPALFASAAFNASGALIGYWSFNNDDLLETSGFKAAGTHDGVASGAVAYTAGVAGFGRALDLTAGNSAVKILNSNMQNNGSAGGGTNVNYQSTYDADINSGPMSISLWMQGTPGAWEPFVSIKGEGPSGGNGYQLRNNGNSSGAAFTLRGTNGVDDPYGAIPIYDGEWHHVAGVWDTATHNRYLYVDGVLDIAGSITNGSDTGNVAAATWEYLVFGARDYGGSLSGFSDMKLDEIRIYNEALTQGQILALIVPEPGIGVFAGIAGFVLLLRRRK